MDEQRILTQDPALQRRKSGVLRPGFGQRERGCRPGQSFAQIFLGHRLAINPPYLRVGPFDLTLAVRPVPIISLGRPKFKSTFPIDRALTPGSIAGILWRTRSIIDRRAGSATRILPGSRIERIAINLSMSMWIT